MLYMEPIENINEDMEDTNEPLTKKKPRSAKQVEAFKIAKEKRASNIEIKKQEKLVKASEILVKNSKLPTPPIETPKPKCKKVIQHESETESEEEIIIVKSKPKKKKVKKIIIEESSDSDSSSSSDDGGQTPAQQSYVQRYAPQQQERVFNSCNYFI